MRHCGLRCVPPCSLTGRTSLTSLRGRWMRAGMWTRSRWYRSSPPNGINLRGGWRLKFLGKGGGYGVYSAVTFLLLHRNIFMYIVKCMREPARTCHGRIRHRLMVLGSRVECVLRAEPPQTTTEHNGSVDYGQTLALPWKCTQTIVCQFLRLCRYVFSKDFCTGVSISPLIIPPIALT